MPVVRCLLGRYGLEIAAVLATLTLAWSVYGLATALEPGEVHNLRVRDYPRTAIARIHLDLTSPDHSVTLTWRGPNAARQPTGPFRSSPGTGWGTNDCNDPVESNCPDSRCTPKGLRRVEGFMDHLADALACRYVTLIDARRRIGFHSSPGLLAPCPSSRGCVRLEPWVARLIHDNSVVGETETLVDGTWTPPGCVGGEGASCRGRIQIWESVEACSKPSVDVSDAVRCCITERTPGSTIYLPKKEATNLSVVGLIFCAGAASDCLGCAVDVVVGVLGAGIPVVGTVIVYIEGVETAIDCFKCGLTLRGAVACCVFRCVPDESRATRIGTRQGC